MKEKKQERLSLAEKNANDKEWYKHQADILDMRHYDLGRGVDGVSEFKKMQVNYDLFNNILNLADFEYVCKPYGSEVGELPAQMVNRDIVSGKIKAMLGMEMKRPFAWNVVATNPEATTRKEQEEYKRIKDYVTAEIVKPIRKQIELQKAQESKGKELTPEEQQQIEQQIEEELQAQTPDSVRKYMQREYQDPSEVMAQQLLQYLVQKCDIKRKFNTTFKHGLLSSRGIMYVGILNGEPEAWNVNSLRFNYERSPDIEFVEDAERASCEYRMTPSEVVKYFGDQLTDSQIDEIYNFYTPTLMQQNVERWLEDVYDTNPTFVYNSNFRNTVRVLHCVWKALRRIGFLTYKDENGELQQMLVDENYKINKEHGDVKIEWEWIPEVYETWKINHNIYVNMRPVPGQFKDLDNLYHCKLPYYGIIYDTLNSQPTSLMDRLKVYQYYYNIVMYRLELLLASDKGKKVLMNINMIPDSAGIDIKKWQYFFESTPFMWYDPNEEGTNYADANTVAKVIDLSMISDIKKYMEIAEYLRQQAGRSVGITEQVEGQISASDAVSNTRQALVQSSHILEYYFDTHARFKKNVLSALLETAKVAYSNSNKRKLTYILDDLSKQIIDLDMGLLDNSTIGLFVENSAQAEETKDTIRQLAHAAMQTSQAGLSDIISVIRQQSIPEMEETLKVAEDKRMQQASQQQQQQLQMQQQMAQEEQKHEERKWEHEKEMVILKEEEKRKTEVVKGSLVGASFNPDQDVDNDGENDFIEIAKHGLNAEVQAKKTQLEREKFEHQKVMDKEKLKNEKEKLKVAKSKTSQKS